jgi:hypothetical protein
VSSSTREGADVAVIALIAASVQLGLLVVLQVLSTA